MSYKNRSKKERIKETMETLQSKYQSDADILNLLRENLDDEFPDLSADDSLSKSISLIEDSKEKKNRELKSKQSRVKSISTDIGKEMDELLYNWGNAPSKATKAKTKPKRRKKK